MRIAKFITCLFSLGYCCAVLACAVIDDTGQKISLNHPAKRIISLAPDLTEILFAAGAGAQIVGVAKGSDYPLAARCIPVMAIQHHFNSEAILLLHPDLIVAWAGGMSAEKIAQLKHFHIPVFLSWQRKITDIPATMTRLGCLAGTERVAQINAQAFLSRYDALQKRYATEKTVSVFYQIGSQPMITITRRSWINEVITVCGGANIFADLPGVAPPVSVEAVIQKNPQAILGKAGHWEQWPTLLAVKNHFIFSVQPDWIERAGPRILDGVQQVCHQLELVRSVK